MRALQLSVYCYRDYTPFYLLPPPLSVFCNLILVWTQAPPPRQLTFPLIHRELPRRPNNYAAVYSHRTASSGLNQLIKAAAVNQLTNQGPLDILLLFCLSCFLNSLAEAACCFGKASRSGKKEMHSATFTQIQLVCCTSA